MRQLQTLIVLLIVSFNATWCLDGCIDPFADRGAQAAPSTASATPDDGQGPLEVSGCVVCVVPFEKEQTVALAPAWTLRGSVPPFDVISPPLAPGHQVEHPPRLL